MDCIVHGVAKSQTWLSELPFTASVSLSHIHLFLAVYIPATLAFSQFPKLLSTWGTSHILFCVPTILSVLTCPLVWLIPALLRSLCNSGPRTKHGPLEEGMANHSIILALRTPWTVWKGKNILHQEMSPEGGKGATMVWEKSKELAPERINRMGQRRKLLSCGCVWRWN